MSQLSLLQSYSKKLEDENQAKANQIKLLREQLDRAGTASSTKIISSTSNINTVLSCVNCKNKDTQINNLNRTVRELKESNEREIQRLSSSRVEKQIIYKDIQLSDNAEYKSLKKSYEQLKSKFDEAEKTKWTSMRVDENTFANHNRQIDALKQQNLSLRTAITNLQKKLAQSQNSNTVIRESATTNISTVQPNQIPVTTTYIGNPLQALQALQNGQNVQFAQSYAVSSPPPLVIETQMESPIISQPISQIQTRPVQFVTDAMATPKFKYSPYQHVHSQSNLYEVPYYSKLEQSSYPIKSSVQHVSYSHYNDECCDCSHLSPLAVLNNRNLEDSYDTEYYKDIVGERWRSLRHKIKILEQQNGKLRSEII